MKVHIPSFRITGTKSPAGFNSKVSSPKSFNRHISEFLLPSMSIPQKSIVRHVALYSRFLPFAGTTSGMIRGGGYGARRNESGESRKKRGRFVSPFRVFLHDSLFSREQGNAFSHSWIPHSWELSPVVRPVPFREVLSLKREGRQAKVRPPTTFTGRATGGEDQLLQQRRTPSQSFSGGHA